MERSGGESAQYWYKFFLCSLRQGVKHFLCPTPDRALQPAQFLVGCEREKSVFAPPLQQLIQ
jgi:hypothetical protein